MKEYNGEINISIRAYYQDRGESTYYRTMKLKDLAGWLEAHTLTHGNVIGYTIQVKRKKEEE